MALRPVQWAVVACCRGALPCLAAGVALQDTDYTAEGGDFDASDSFDGDYGGGGWQGSGGGVLQGTRGRKPGAPVSYSLCWPRTSCSIPCLTESCLIGAISATGAIDRPNAFSSIAWSDVADFLEDKNTTNLQKEDAWKRAYASDLAQFVSYPTTGGANGLQPSGGNFEKALNDHANRVIDENAVSGDRHEKGPHTAFWRRLPGIRKREHL